MCGIALLYSHAPIESHETDIIQRMQDLQRHRGPDDSGLTQHEHCILGHVRLAIIDTSSNGHQPFISDDGRYELVYNGEIYNYIELRQELQARGWHFHTQTDTEVLLKAFQQYGIQCLDKFNGMFACAIYDTHKNCLFFARDRVGIKPLYYVHQGERWYFASEMKTFQAIPDLQKSLNHEALFDYLVFNRTDIHETTFVNEIHRLPKGHYATLDETGLTIRQWWRPLIMPTLDRPYDEITSAVEETMKSAVRLRLRSDVPVGTCLSGGLDSSIITGLIHDSPEIGDNFTSFTVAFPGYNRDETADVDKLNEKYPFRNYRITPSASEAINQLKQFIWVQDEPTASPSYFAQFKLMQLAREQHTTVLLDGQGGDESFAGHQYMHAYHLLGLMQRKQYWNFTREWLAIMVRRQEWLTFKTFAYSLMSYNLQRRAIQHTQPNINRDYFVQQLENSPVFNNFLTARSLNESIIRHFEYKLEHLLRTEDRNSMAFSIEARVPYLDHRLIELLLSIPEQYKIRAGETKRLQKDALGKYTTQHILSRKDKIGFATPEREWMDDPDWQKRTNDSLDFLSRRLPEVFPKSWTTISNPNERWKMNQLAVWIVDFLDTQPYDNTRFCPAVRTEASVQAGANSCS